MENLWLSMHSGVVVVLRFQHCICGFAVWLYGRCLGRHDCIIVGDELDGAKDVVCVSEAGEAVAVR